MLLLNAHFDAHSSVNMLWHDIATANYSANAQPTGHGNHGRAGIGLRKQTQVPFDQMVVFFWRLLWAGMKPGYRDREWAL